MFAAQEYTHELVTAEVLRAATLLETGALQTAIFNSAHSSCIAVQRAMSGRRLVA